MNLERLIPTTCCFCLQLRTGTIIFAVLYLLFSIILLLDEMYSAIVIFSRYHLEHNIVAVASMDLVPTSSIVFSLMIIYGSVKDIPRFVNLGVVLTGYFAIRNVYFLICFMLNAGFRHYSFFRMTLDELIAATIFQGIFLLVVWSHHRVISQRKPPPNRGVESPFHEFNNPVIAE